MKAFFEGFISVVHYWVWWLILLSGIGFVNILLFVTSIANLPTWKLFFLALNLMFGLIYCSCVGVILAIKLLKVV